MGVTNGDARSLDYGSFHALQNTASSPMGISVCHSRSETYFRHLPTQMSSFRIEAVMICYMNDRANASESGV